MKYSSLIKVLLFVFFSYVSFLYAQNTLITNIKDTTTTCDYLIITPADFVTSSIRLAEHRNTFTGDSVENARVVLLDSIYSEFTLSDTLHQYEIIWYGLKWMYENWELPFSYLLLMGDDSLVVDTSDSTIYSYGRMPTFIMGYIGSGSHVEYRFSDDWYTTLQCATIPNPDFWGSWLDTLLYKTPFVVGRIPCETVEQCSLFITKTISFDLNAPLGNWKNKALFTADDHKMGTGIDLFQFYYEPERLSDSLLSDYFPTKCYLSCYPLDNNGEHTKAKEFYFEQVNRGALWSINFGHANAYQFTDEKFLYCKDVDRFHNDSTPVIFFSFSCGNGKFDTPYEANMCKKFLLKPVGGCIAFIASTQSEYFTPNNDFAEDIFSFYASNPTQSIGNYIFAAKRKYLETRTLPDGFAILGDPALTLCNSIAELSCAIVPDTVNPTTIICSVTTPSPFIGNYYYSFIALDSVTVVDHYEVTFLDITLLQSAEDTFSSSFEIPIPREAADRDVRFIAYVWNDSTEGRADTLLQLDITDIVLTQVSQQLAPEIQQNHNRIIIHTTQPSGDYITEIALFNIRGQTVYAVKLSGFQDKISIDLQRNGLAPGNYLLRIKTAKTSFSRRVLYLK